MQRWLTLFVFFAGGCSVYDGSLGPGDGAAGAADPAGAGGDPAGAGGASGAAGDGVSTASGVGGDSSGVGGSATGDTTTGVGGVATSGTGDSTGAGGEGGGAGNAGGKGGSGGALTGGTATGSGGNGGNGGTAGNNAGTSGATGSGGTGLSDAGIADRSVDATAKDGSTICSLGACKRVFVSSQPPAPSGKLGGTAGADMFCQTTADANQLGGVWKAWVSDATTSPASRFSHPAVPYRLLNGTIIANDWTSLTSGTLLHAIDVFEDGTSAEAGASFEVWTGTRPAGTYTGNSCNNWTNETATAPNGDVGVTNQTGAQWSQVYMQYCNRTTIRVYCFEQ